MKRTFKSILAALLSVLVVMTLLPVSVFAAESVEYQYYDAGTGGFVTGNVSDYTVVTASDSDTTWGTVGETTWYVVSGTVEINGTVTVTGDVHLILTDGCDLTVSKGIQLVGENSNLTIYGQQNNTGKLTATGGQFAAGIGSGYGGSCGNITINGGSITANGGMSGAGIGSGRNSNCGNITINGGSIVATGGQYAAGIGSGDGSICGNITISGGSIEATGGESGAGIGSGNQGICGNIIIAQGVGTNNITGRIGSEIDVTCGAIFIDGKLTETSALNRDLIIPAGMTLTIPAGKALTIPAGMTLTIESGATLTNNGAITNNGTIVADCNAVPANITGSGTVEKRHNIDSTTGICTGCSDAYQPATLDATGSCYEISNAGQLYWFAEQVNSGNTGINGKLMNNITVNTGVLDANGQPPASFSGRTWTPIGTNSTYAYQGTFDGQGYTIRGLYAPDPTYSGEQQYSGLFGKVNSGTISNVHVQDSYFSGTGANVRAGGICGRNDGGSFTNCSFDGIVKAAPTDNSSCNAGGICGENYGSIKNCTNRGSVTAETGNSNAIVGGICGYNGGSITNCINSGSVKATANIETYAGGICGYNRGEISSCYYLDTAFTGDPVGQNNGTVADTVKSKTAEQFASGEVTWLLNGGNTTDPVVFHQTIGEDAYPTLDSAKGIVYSYTNCMLIRFYTNDSTASDLPHDFGNWTSISSTQHKGICSVCGAEEIVAHNFTGLTCGDCGFVLNTEGFVPTQPEKPVTPQVVTHFATTIGNFKDVAYFGRKAREGDVVLLKVSNTDEGDRLGLDYHNIRVEYQAEGCTMVRDNIDYHGDPLYKDGIAAEFKLAKGLNKVTATVYYNDTFAGTFQLFYCYIS